MSEAIDPDGPLAALHRLNLPVQHWAADGERKTLRDGVTTWTYETRFLGSRDLIALGHLLVDGWRAAAYSRPGPRVSIRITKGSADGS